MNTQQKFWQNPYAGSELNLPKNYVEFCKPSYYIYLEPVSEYIVKTLKKWAPVHISELSVLELGCNSGRNLAALANAGFGSVSGIEINPECLNIAAEYFHEIWERIIIGSIERVLPSHPPVDIIFTQGVLMHIPHDNIDEIADAARGKASMVITTEVETTEWRDVKFERNYRDIFAKKGMKELWVGSTSDVPYINTSTTRVFSNIE